MGRTLEPGGARPGGTPVAGSEQESPEGGAVTDGPAEGGVEAAAEPPKEDVYLSEMAECDDDDFPVPWPNIAVAEGRERDDLRLELVDKVKSLLKVIQAALEQALEEQAAPLSRLERDGLQATPHPHAELMRREEESCFRQFVRMGNFLMNSRITRRSEKKVKVHPGMLMKIRDGGKKDLVTESPEPEASDREASGQIVRGAEARPKLTPSPRSERESPKSGVRGSESGAKGRQKFARSSVGRRPPERSPRSERERPKSEARGLASRAKARRKSVKPLPTGECWIRDSGLRTLLVKECRFPT